MTSLPLVESSPGLSPVTDSTWRRWVLQRFGVYTRACLAAAVFLVPVSVHAATVDSFMLVKLTVLWFLVVCALAFWVSRAAELQRWLPPARLGYAALAFLSACAVATAFSSQPGVSLIGRAQRYGGLLPLVVYVVMMLLVVGVYAERPRDLREILWGSVAGSSVVSLYVLVQAAGLDWNRWVGAFGAPSEFPIGTLGNSNFAGSYLAIALPLVLYLLFFTARRPLMQAVLGALCGFHVLALWFTQTRGGMLGGAAGVAAMALLARGHLPRWMRRAGAGAVALALLVVVLAIWHPGLDRTPGPLSLVRTSTLENRVYYWQAAAKIIRQHPVVGTGPDTFYAHYPQFRSEAEALKNPLVMTDKPHNIFLEHATDTGLVGAGIYLLVVALALVYGVRGLRTADSDRRTLLVCALGAFVAYLVQGIFSIDVPSSAFMGWVLLGAIAVLADPGASRERRPRLATAGDRGAPPRSPARSSRWYVSAVAATGAVTLILVGTRPLRADVAARAGRPAEAMRLQPLESEYPAQAGNLERSLAVASEDHHQQVRHLERAQGYYVEARRLERGNVNYTSDLAALNTIWALAIEPGRFAVARVWWRRAMAEDPKNAAVRARYDKAVDDMRASARELEETANSYPGDAQAWLQAATAYFEVGEMADARVAVERAIGADPDRKEARELLARIPL